MNYSGSVRHIDILLTWPGDGLRLFQSMIPMGLISIGTVLKQAGYRVKVIDFNHYTSDFRRELRKLQPKVIGIGGTTPSRRGSFLTAKLAKEVLPDVPVVYGGVNATFTAVQVLENVLQIDYIIKGEGEFAFLSLCDMLTGRKPVDLQEIHGLCYRNAHGITEQKPQRINDLSCISIGDRSLVGDHYRLEMEFIGGNGDFIVTSRGCPAACNFCSAARMFPGGVRVRPIPQVMDEVEYLVTRKNIAGLKLFDSTFTSNREHVINFCRHIRAFDIPWECEVRADTVDRDLLRLMKESGCYYINMGMETSHEKHLRTIAKGISPKQVLEVLDTCRNIGMFTKVFFTFGHIGQTFDECMQDIRFIDENRETIGFFAVTVGMRVYPGTRLEKVAQETGLIDTSLNWTRNTKFLRNLLLFEPGDIPILFQKQLGPLRLLAVLLLLLTKRLICTEKFLLRMIIENITGIFRTMKMQGRYTWHRIRRVYEGI